MDKRLALVAVALLIVACSAPATSLNRLHQDELCPYNCSGHGRCKFGRCLCDHGFTGISCDRADPTCPNNCAGRGRCDGEKCVCDVGFGGSNCGRALARTCPGSCSGHGTCLADGSCVCNPGFSGAACEVLAASPGCAHSCSGRGWCAGGSCACTYGFSGAACESITQENRCPANCSGHGTCAQHPNPAIAAAGGSVCRCEAGWSGSVCDHFDVIRQRRSCPLGCSGHGVCVRGSCVCDTGFGGDACSALLPAAGCAAGCSGRGECRAAPRAAGALPGVRLSHTIPYRQLQDNGAWKAAPSRRDNVCVCHDGFSGPTCAIGTPVAPACPAACSGHGFCRDGGCVCESGFGGDDCGVVCPGGCSGHGRCTDEGACVCEPGFHGEACAVQSACMHACSMRGVCGPSTTAADDQRQYEAAAAEARDALAAAEAAVTSVDAAKAFARAAADVAAAREKVAVESKLPRCHCPRGWGAWGANATYSPSEDCSQRDQTVHGCAVGCGHGKCVDGACVCAHGWSGPHCATDAVDARRAWLTAHGLLAATATTRDRLQVERVF